MKLQQLAYFVETYKYQNMSIASRKLLVSQPSISAAIRELEQEFDTPLFHRQGKRLLPTKEGDTLYALSLQLFEQIDIISKTMKEMKRANNTIRLGIPPMIDALLLTPVLKTFMTQHPEVKLSIYEQGSSSLVKAFQSDVIDCAFITEASNPVPTPLLGHRCRSSQEITGSPTPFSTSNHYLWICESASFSLSNPNIAA